MTFSKGEASWTASDGSLYIEPPNTSETNTWEAPDYACSVTITAVGINGTGTATIQFTVVEPRAVRLLRAPDSLVKHTECHPDIGIKAIVSVLPADVSFAAVFLREEECTSNDTGVYELMPDKGHHPNEDPQQCSETVSESDGTYFGTDTLYSADPVLDIVPPPEPPYVPGHRILTIPIKFKLLDGNEHLLDCVDSVVTLEDDQITLSVSKDQASGSCDVGSGTEDYY